jgi:hypothetical protein
LHSILAALTAFLLVRRQALRDEEPVWSPPTRRVIEALAPSLIAGGAVGLLLLVFDVRSAVTAWHAAVIWVILYGCALCAAGFFTPRGLKRFGMAFVCAGGALHVLTPVLGEQTGSSAHHLMGFFFGALHFAYGLYLYFTERQRRA